MSKFVILIFMYSECILYGIFNLFYKILNSVLYSIVSFEVQVYKSLNIILVVLHQ